MPLIDFFRNYSEFQSAFNILKDFWWVYSPVILFLGFFFAWQQHMGEQYFKSLQWVLLKIKPPPLVDRSPKAVEQIFAGLHGIFVKSVSWKEHLFKGKIADWFSLEIVGSEGATNFYIRTLSQYKNIVESNFFAQYPDAEITEVPDYMESWPKTLPNNEYDVFGAELMLSKDDAYPIQTYPFFEEKIAGKEDVKRLDPLASLSEVFSTFHPGEHFVVQLLIKPVGDGWIKDTQKAVDKILGKEPKKNKNLIDSAFESIDSVLLGASAPPKEEKKEKKLTALEEEVIKAIGRKVSKIGFECGLRLMYVAKKEIFHRYHFAAVTGVIRQFSTAHLNSFKTNKGTLTFSKGKLSSIFPSDRGFFADQIALEKKLSLFKDLKDRGYTDEEFILNTEELATIYHMPGVEVKAPLFPRVEAKKGQPPAGLELE